MLSHFMEVITFITIFVIILFIYSHIQFELKENNTNELIYITEPTKDELEELYKLKHPFYFNSTMYTELFKHLSLTNLVEILGDTQLTCLKNIHDEDISLNCLARKQISYKIQELISNITKENTFIQCVNNSSTTEKIINTLCKQDSFSLSLNNLDNLLKPFLNMSTKRDILTGSIGTVTDFTVNTYSRKYMCITEGECEIILISPANVPCHSTGIDINYDIQGVHIKKTLYVGDICVVPNGWGYYIRYNDICSVLDIGYKSNFWYVIEYLRNLRSMLGRIISNVNS